MAENVASGSANVNDPEVLKLAETVKGQNERIEQLEKASKAKDNLIQTLKNALIAKEKLVQFLKEKMKEFGNSGIDEEKDKNSGDEEKGNENVRKTMKGENDQENQSQETSSIESDVPTEAAIKVGRIPMILNMVLKSMKNCDLLRNCRLVSREWRDLSTSILLLRKTLEIYFIRHGDCKNFMVFILSKLYKPRDLTELTAFLTTSKTFPCARFIFHGNLKSDDAQEFLAEFGRRVKGIKLVGAQDLNFVRKLFVEQIPQVERLDLSEFVAQENSDSGSGSKIFPEDSQTPAPAPQLSRLTFLKLGSVNSPELVKEILDAAPNLQECFGIGSKAEIEWLRPRLDIVRGVQLKAQEDDSPRRALKVLSMLRFFLEKPQQLHTQLQLTFLQVNCSSARLCRNNPTLYGTFCEMVAKILSGSQTTLKELKFAPDPSSEYQIDWSKLELEKVEKLILKGDWTRDFVRLFPPPQVSQIFPNLRTIHFKGIDSMTAEQLTVFEDHPPIPISSVKSLFVYTSNEQFLKVFAPLFPNVTHLFITGQPGSTHPDSFLNLAPIIWQMMRGLKSLQVEFNCPGAEFDAAFTGMEENTCKLIRTLGGGEFLMEEIDKFRVNPSILNLTELEALFLPIGFSEDESPKYNDERRAFFGNDDDFRKATFISFKYAFKLMPKLRVFPHADF